MMPGLGGLELLAALRADSRTARVPVLLLSARAGQSASVEGLAAGADDYLVKPFSAEELLARVGAHLQLGRARREAEARFTAMADLAPALIWVADPAGTRVFVNRGWQQFTGHSVDELGEGWHTALHPQDRQRYLEVVAAATAAHEGWEVEFRLRRADGVYRWMLERAVPVGPTEGWVGSCTDINARYRESERQTLLARFGAGLEGESGPAARMGRLARLVIDTRLADLCCVLRRDASGRLRQEGIAAVDADVEAALAAVDLESSTVQEVVTSGRPRLLSDVPGRRHRRMAGGPAGGPRRVVPPDRRSIRAAGAAVRTRSGARRAGVAAPRRLPPLRRRRSRAGGGGGGSRRAGAGQCAAARRRARDGGPAGRAAARDRRAFGGGDARRGRCRGRRPSRPSPRRLQHRRRVRDRRLRDRAPAAGAAGHRR